MTDTIAHAASAVQPQTVADAFAHATSLHAGRPFVCVLPETASNYRIAPGELTYADAQMQIERLRTAYAQAGYGHGHRVGLLLENRPAFFLHWFALNALGVSVVPISAELRSAELEYLIGHSEVVLVIALAARHADLAAAARAAGRPLALMADDAADVPLANITAPKSGQPIDVQTECALLYTSGTTGRPKGCILPNRYFLKAGQWYADIGGLAELERGAERMLTPLPLVHMNAMAYSTLACVLTGGCLIVLDRFHPNSWWQNVRESKATVVHYLGVMPAILMKAPPHEQDTAHTVRFGFGAGVDRRLHAGFEERFGFPLLEAWAMTETGAGAVVIANNEPRQIGTSCFGSEAKEVELKLVADSGSEAAVDEPGELLVRCRGNDPRDGFFAGYLKDDAATDEAWVGGWFHTGDIVRRGASGSLHFIDRRKNVIRRSGENISAVEVESVLLQHDKVRAAAVAPVPDAVRGDEVFACIASDTPLTDAQAREQLAHDLVQWCLERLAYFKAPGHIAFVDALPLTTSQKVQRGELRTLAQSLVGTAGCIDTTALKKRQH